MLARLLAHNKKVIPAYVTLFVPLWALSLFVVVLPQALLVGRAFADGALD